MSEDSQRIGAFLDMLAVERGAADNTLQAYRRDLDDAVASLPSGLVSASGADLTGYQQSLSKQGMAASTIARRPSALRQFYRFEVEEGLRTTNPASDLVTPTLRRNVPDVLSREDMTTLLAACEGESVRDRRISAFWS